MAKYIDADMLKKAFEQTSAREDGYYPNNVVDSIPAADVVEVVRCKDCKYWNGIACIGYIAACMNADDFCSCGERAENGSNDTDEYPVCFNMI